MTDFNEIAKRWNEQDTGTATPVAPQEDVFATLQKKWSSESKAAVPSAVKAPFDDVDNESVFMKVASYPGQLSNELSKALLRGTGGILKVAPVALEILGKQIGFEELEEGAQAAHGAMDRMVLRASRSEDINKSVFENPEILLNPKWWVSTAGEQAPLLALSLLTGGAAGAAVKAGASKLPFLASRLDAATRVGQAIIGGGAQGLVVGSGTYKDMLASGATEEEALRGAGIQTALTTGLSAISVGKMLKKLPTGFKARLFGRTTAGLVEGGAEYIEEILDPAVKRGAQGESLFSEEAFAQYSGAMKQGLDVLGPSFLLGFIGAGSDLAGVNRSLDSKVESNVITEKRASSVKESLGHVNKITDKTTVEDLTVVNEAIEDGILTGADIVIDDPDLERLGGESFLDIMNQVGLDERWNRRQARYIQEVIETQDTEQINRLIQSGDPELEEIGRAAAEAVHRVRSSPQGKLAVLEGLRDLQKRTPQEKADMMDELRVKLSDVLFKRSHGIALGKVTSDIEASTAKGAEKVLSRADLAGEDIDPAISALASKIGGSEVIGERPAINIFNTPYEVKRDEKGAVSLSIAPSEDVSAGNVRVIPMEVGAVEATFIGFQGDAEGNQIPLFNIAQDIEGHPAGSTVTEVELNQAGIPIPPIDITPDVGGKIIEEPVSPPGITPEPTVKTLPGEPAPGIPPVETMPPPLEVGAIGLGNKNADVLLAALSREPLPPSRSKAFSVAVDEANAADYESNALDIADNVIKTNRGLSDAEYVGLTQKVISLEDERVGHMGDVEVALERGDDVGAERSRKSAFDALDSQEKIIEASQIAGSEQSRAFSIRRMLLDRESMRLVDVIQRAKTSKGAALSVTERTSLETAVADFEIVRAKYEAELASHEETKGRLDSELAEKALARETKKAAITTKTEKRKQKILSERDDIKRQLNEMGYRLNDIVGVSTEGSYLVGRLAVNYIKDGANSLNEVIQKVLVDLPELTERDVLIGLNTTNPKAQRRALLKAQGRVIELKKQAKLLVDIENAESGAFAVPGTRKATKQSVEVRKLKTQLKKLRDTVYSAGEVEMSSTRLASIIKKINEAQDHLENQHRAIRKKQPLLPNDIADAKEKLALIRREMRTEDALAIVEDQIRTGNFALPVEEKAKIIPLSLEKKQVELSIARKKVRNMIRELQPQGSGIGRVVDEFASFTRAMKATADLSATLRQGLVLVTRSPKTALRNFAKSLKATFNEYTAQAMDVAIKSDNRQWIRDRSKLELSEIDGRLGKREEMFMSRLIHRVPVLGPVVRASERHMTTFLNLMRVSAFDDFVARHPNATDAELKAWADFVNVASGKGSIKAGVGAMRTLNTLMFAPKFAASRIQTPQRLLKHWKEPRVRKEIAKSLAATFGTGMMTLALARLMGADVGDDPRESEWGKIVIDDTKIDVWGGFQQPMRLIASVIAGGLEAGDVIEPAGRGIKSFGDIAESVGRFAGYKASPAITIPHEIVFGRDVIGKEVTVPETVANALLPLVIQDIYEAYKVGGTSKAALVAPLVMLGVGASTYEKKGSKKKIKSGRSPFASTR